MSNGIAISRVGETHGAAVQNLSVAPARQTLAGAMLIAAFRGGGAAFPVSVTDTKGGEWALLAQQGPSGATLSVWGRIAADPLTMADTVTASFSIVAGASALLIEAASLTGNVDRVSGAAANAPLTVPATSPISSAPQLAFSAAIQNPLNAGPWTIPSGWTPLLAENPANTVGAAWQWLDTVQPAGPTTWVEATRAVIMTLPVTVPAILTNTLPVGTANQPYSAQLQAEGGVGALTWSIADGSLPPGLTLDPATGVISGTPEP